MTQREGRQQMPGTSYHARLYKTLNTADSCLVHALPCDCGPEQGHHPEAGATRILRGHSGAPGLEAGGASAAGRMLNALSAVQQAGQPA